MNTSTQMHRAAAADDLRAILTSAAYAAGDDLEALEIDEQEVPELWELLEGGDPVIRVVRGRFDDEGR